MPGDIGDIKPFDVPGIPPECLFFAGVTPESVRQVEKFLDYEKVMKLCCRVIKHPNCCVLCARNNDCTKIPMHVRCFPAGTIVSGPRAVASVTRWYCGELVEFKTRAGAVVSATPNHPILTAKGWIGAGLLNQGDQVVRERWSDGLVVGDPDEYQEPAPIEEVARSVAGRTAEVAVTGGSFHGDGAGSHRATVTTRDSRDAVLATSGSGVVDGAVLLKGLAEAVVLDEVVDVRRMPFEGYVYNLETVHGWYAANSLIVSNCRCRAEPFICDEEK